MPRSTALYSNSMFPGSSIEEEANFGPDALFGNSTEPPVAIQKENPRHDEVIRLRVLRHTIKQIAAITGYTVVHVGNILRQPWAKDKINLLCKERGIQMAQRSGMEIAQEAVPAAILKLVERMDSENSPASVQRACAVDLKDMIYGKPKEKVEFSSNFESLTPAQIDALAALLPPEPEPTKRN